MRKAALLVLLLLLGVTPSTASVYDEGYEYISSSGDVEGFESSEYIVLDSMATWCGPCRVQMLHLQEVHSVVESESEVSLLTMSMDPTTDTIEKLGEFMEGFDAEWDYGLDHNGDLLNYFNVTGYPTTIILSPEGDILKKWLGITEADEILLELDQYVELDGALGRSIQLGAMIDQLLNSPFFFFFLMSIWLAIFYIGYTMIQKLKPSTLEESEEKEVLYSERE